MKKSNFKAFFIGSGVFRERHFLGIVYIKDPLIYLMKIKNILPNLSVSQLGDLTFNHLDSRSL